MAKSTKTTKKTPEEKQADLLALIGGGGITTLSDLSQHVGQDASSEDDKEQKGEKAPAAPSQVIPASPEQALPASVPTVEGVADLEAQAPQPVVETEVAPIPVADELPTNTETPADAPAAAPAAELQPTAPDLAENPPTAEQPIASVSTPPATPEPAPAPESVAVSEPASPLDFTNLFKANSPGRKGITSRLSEPHYKYLQMLGTVLGNRTTVPEIVSNIIDLFIEEHDNTIQKALTKKMRAARTAPKNS